MALFESLLQLLFPDRCVGCRLRGTLLCTSCSDLPPAIQPQHDWITSVFSYHDRRMRALVQLLKYKKIRHVTLILAAPMAHALREFVAEERYFLSTAPIILVPVPLSKKRLRQRGYNQAELLAREICRVADVACEVRLLVEKFVDTEPQARIKNKAERLRNLGACFRMRKHSGSYRNVVVLIDDVTTTGTTLAAARKVLRAAGFRTIYAITAAH